jgi:hypothetical protein
MHFTTCVTTLLAATTAILAANTSGLAGVNDAAVSVPKSICADLSEDVTGELNQFLDSLPDGSTVLFPSDARYRIDGTVLIEGKESITIEGGGVLFRAFDPGEEHAKQENYTGWKRTRCRAHIRISGGRNILVRDVEVHGAHPNAGQSGIYDSNREAQHGFDLIGVEGCTLENVTVHDVYGDCVYMSKVRSVIVRDSKLTRCGRQGIAVGTGEDVLIENNEIGDSRRGVIDIEPYGKEWRASNIRIIGNRLGGSRLLLLPMGGSGRVGTVFVADNINTQHNGTPAVSNTGHPGQHRGPFIMINNRLSIGGSPTQGLRVKYNDGVFIAGNKLLFPERRKMTALDLEGSHGAVVGNGFVDAAELIKKPTDMALLSNELGAGAENLPAEWKQIAGGFAARVTLEDGEVIALMRGGARMDSPPVKIEAYGRSTTAKFAWFHVRDGELVNSDSRE